MAPAAILLIRHAQSLWNAKGLWQGQADPPLSSEGRSQAAEAARRLAGEQLDALVASDLVRACETAEILGKVLGLETTLDARLRELDVGEWSGRTPSEIERHWPEDLARLRAGDLEVRPGGGETWDELQRRVRVALDEIGARHPDGRVAVVTHLGVARSVAPGIRLAHTESRWLDEVRLLA